MRSLIILLIVLFGILLYQRIQRNRIERIIKSQEEEISEELPFKVPFKYLITEGETVINTCHRLRKEKTETTPVIFGGYDNFETLLETEFEDSPAEIIQKSLEVNLKNYLDERFAEDFEIDTEMIGDWPMSEVVQPELVAHKELLSGRPLEKVFIGLIPTSKSYEIPAFLNFGGWNECPDSEIHVAIMRYWHEKYGADIISVTPDTVECTVKKPPQTKEEALALAKEQFIYCPDIVFQGTGTISNLAASLINAENWYFWWD